MPHRSWPLALFFALSALFVFVGVVQGAVASLLDLRRARLAG